MNKKKLAYKEFKPTIDNFPILGFQSSETRSINVGLFEEKKGKLDFIPCRLNLGGFREEMTYKATVQTFGLPKVRKIIDKYKNDKISTVTILREASACRLSSALYKTGIKNHFGDCFIGANHVKKSDSITVKYSYENKEGLCNGGLWILADSIAAGRNILATFNALLTTHKPKEILFLVPIGNRWGINKISNLIASYKIKATFVVWGALFGLNPENRYDEPWGLEDCEPIDKRDQKTFVDMYGPHLCVGGDFGNDYYCPLLARELYADQLKKYKIKPQIPSYKSLMKTYSKNDFVIR